MGTVLSLMIAASTRALALDASEAAVRAVEDSERRLSTWRSDTELAALNRHPVGADFPLSPALATSGNGQRRRDGRRPHLLDPRTGRPAPDFGSLSVWALSALEADALSTGLFVLGPEAALAWAQRHPQYGVIVVERGEQLPRLRLSRALASGHLPLIVEELSPGSEL